MAQKQILYNTSITEAGAHTIKTSTVEVPGSSGAKRVVMHECRIMVDAPDSIASKLTTVGASVCTGTRTPTTTKPSEQGQVAEAEQCLYSAAGPAVVQYFGTADGKLNAPVDIVPETDNRKFNITMSVLGSADNTNAKTAYFAMRFVVDF